MGGANQTKKRSTKATTMVVAVVFTISASGYFMGLRQTVRESESLPDPVEPLQQSGALESQVEAVAGNVQDTAVGEPSGVPRPAVGYSELAEASFKPNRNWSSRLSDLKPAPTKLSALWHLSRDAETVRRERAARRAYDGAPPVAPHPIDQISAESCLQCHGQALAIGSIVAPEVSHPDYTSCTQCHVSSEGLGSRWNTSDFDLHTGNRFAGYHEIEQGARAYPDAPPTVPHALHMRQNCMSCHGPLGNSPIRTTHPERQSCLQCHVPGSEVDKSNFSESPFPFLETLARGVEGSAFKREGNENR